MTLKNFDLAKRIRAVNRPTTGQFILMGIGLIVTIGLFVFLNGFVACWRLTSLPGMPVPSCPNTNNQTPQVVDNTQGTPAAVTGTPTLAAPEAPLPAAWDGASRVTIMIVGVDYRDWVAGIGAPRSDTMILLTIDPVNKTAAMLSVPRDMWVNIPGFGYNKINAAYADGEGAKLPGGGPALAAKTLETFLGVDIQYYAEVDFQTFQSLIDNIGGIDVNVPAQITVDPLGQHNTTILQPGMNHLDGPLALAYARMRHTANDDLDRAGRQQQVILAIRDKVLSPGTFPKLVAQAPTIYNELSSGIKTNLTLDQALQLAVLAKDIPLNQIQKYVIDYTMCAPETVVISGQSQDILKPFPDKIRELVAKVFGTGTVEPLASGDPTQLMQAENAKVLVVNGSGVNGAAQTTFDYLKSQGVNVVNFGNIADYPDAYAYPPLPSRTMIIVHAGKPYVMKYLMSLMKFNSQSQIVVKFDPNASADIVLVVGADYVNAIPGQ